MDARWLAALEVVHRGAVPAARETPTAMSLLEAAAILRNDRCERAEARRRRAIARLAAGLPDGKEATRTALAALSAPVPQIEATLASAGAADFDTRERLVWNQLNESLGPVWPECDVKILGQGVKYDEKTGIMTGTVTLSLRRDVNKIFAAMDPQTWSTCANRLFVASYIAARDRDGYHVDGEYDARRGQPSIPGTTWEGVLFEHFVLSHDLTLSWFRNLLSVDTHRSSDDSAYRMNYHLYERPEGDGGVDGSIRSSVLGDNREGGILRDEGFCEAQRDAYGVTRVTAVKGVKFADRRDISGAVLTQSARPYLLAMAWEIADALCSC